MDIPIDVKSGDDVHSEPLEVAGIQQYSTSSSSSNPLRLLISFFYNYLAFYGFAPGISWLLQHGAQIDAADLEGDTPLHNAIFCDRVDAVKVLLQAGISASLSSFFLLSLFGSIRFDLISLISFSSFHFK